MATEGKANLAIVAVDKTKAAFDSVKGNLKGLDGAAEQVGAKFGSLGTLIAGAVTGVSFASVANLLDDLDKLSEKTGIGVGKLSELRFAAESNSVPFETLSAGMVKLNKNMADATGGSKEAIAKFEALGISLERIKTATPGEVLLDIADKISTFRDGANKSALAGEAFGKSIGPDLIPFLNQGRDGIAKLSEEARKLGVVYDADLSKKASEFNDNLRKLKFAAEGAAAALSGGLIKSLADATSFLVEATKEAGRLQGLLITIGAGFAKLLKTDEIGKLQTQAQDISAEIERVTNVLTGLSNVIERDPGNETAKRRYANLSAGLKSLQDQAAQTSSALKVAADVAQFGDNPITITRGLKPDAPVVDKAGAVAKAVSEYDKLIKRISERGAAEQAELDVGRELTAAEKFRVEITTALREALSKLTPTERALAETARERVVSLIEQNDAAKEHKKLLEEQAKLVQQQTHDLLRQTLTQRAYNKDLADANQEMGLSVDALEELQIARLRVALATAEQAEAQANLDAGTAGEITASHLRVEVLKEEIALREAGAAKAKAQARDSSFGFSKAVDNYVRESERIGDAIDRLTSDTLRNLEDELTHLLTGQKTNFRGLIDTLIAEVVRLKVVKPLIAEIFGGNGGIASSLAGLVGTAGAVADGSYNANYGNEGRNYMTPSSMGTGGMTYAAQISVSVDSRTDQAAVAAATAQGVQEGNKQMLQLLKTRGVL